LVANAPQFVSLTKPFRTANPISAIAELKTEIDLKRAAVKGRLGGVPPGGFQVKNPTGAPHAVLTTGASLP